MNDLQSKLVLLVLAFPILRIIWSSSPYNTAEIFEDLKRTHEEPDPIKVVQYGLLEGEDITNVFNQGPLDFLRAVPGITSKNYRNVIQEFDSIKALSNATKEKLVEIIGPESGNQVYYFFNKGAAAP